MAERKSSCVISCHHNSNLRHRVGSRPWHASDIGPLALRTRYKSLSLCLPLPLTSLTSLTNALILLPWIDDYHDQLVCPAATISCAVGYPAKIILGCPRSNFGNGSTIVLVVTCIMDNDRPSHGDIRTFRVRTRIVR